MELLKYSSEQRCCNLGILLTLDHLRYVSVRVIRTRAIRGYALKSARAHERRAQPFTDQWNGAAAEVLSSNWESAQTRPCTPVLAVRVVGQVARRVTADSALI
ncbi:hypothetical protein EVAR_50046_1 [Eumeta japonica]|uniref:Uncharacterized protein n=1 Tax=Eumeta variegata TaxID=151549 RepID=A0A4C1XIZ6_EUMVA|nr:hypothetical protein EVAR_50046_1 [Eumeta japonica]